MSRCPSYVRVMPRDLFNEASLLKCLGRLWIELEREARGKARLVRNDESAPFDIVQDESSGAISVDSLWLKVGSATYVLERPLNSRDNWPLYAIRTDDPEQEETSVFGETGALSVDFLRLIGALSMLEQV